jgi:DNA-binding transcriptional regulator YiaG
MAEPTEEWRPCARNPNYAVSSLGRVKRIADSKTHKATGACLRQSLRAGYPFVQFSSGGKRENVLIHHLVAEAFLGPQPDGKNIHHRDADKTNACPENLEYVSQSDNVKASYACGNADRSRERNTQAKLTGAKAEEIRALTRAGGLTQRAIAERYGVTEGAVRAILAGRTWRPR